MSAETASVQARIDRLTRQRWALNHDCPRCKAEPREKCFSMTGASKRVPPHAERIAAAEAWMAGQ